MLRRRAGPQALGVNLDALAQYLGGTIATTNTITFPGPGHSISDRSASVTFTPDAWNGVFKTHSYANRDEVPEIERVVFEALDAIGWSGEGLGEVDERSAKEKKEDGRQRARWMWGFGRDAKDTVVEEYLRKRCVRLPPGDVIQYWRFGHFGQNKMVPLMLAKVSDIKNDEGIAVHRTALSLDAEKAYYDLYGNMDCRAFAGSPKGGAIKLFPLAEVLGVGEGIETSLSLREMKGWKDLAVWSLMSDIGLSKFPVLEGVRKLIIAEDNDQGGITATAELAQRWRAAGREVQIVGTRSKHPELNDINDLVRRIRHGQEQGTKGARGL